MHPFPVPSTKFARFIKPNSISGTVQPVSIATAATMQAPKHQKHAHPAFGPGDEVLVFNRLKAHYKKIAQKNLLRLDTHIDHTLRQPCIRTTEDVPEMPLGPQSTS